MKEDPADTWELANRLEALAKMLKKAPRLFLTKKIEISQITTKFSQLPDYRNLTVKALRAECKKRGIKIPRGSNKADVVKLLERYDSKTTTIDQISAAFGNERR